MKRNRHSLLRLLVGSVALSLSVCLPIDAQTTLKGRWQITIAPHERATLTTGFVIRKNGQGKAGNAFTGGPVAVRQTGTTIEIAWQYAGPVFATEFQPGPATILLRAAAPIGDTIHGTALLITDEVDDSSPLGYVVITGEFSGVRNSSAQ